MCNYCHNHYNKDQFTAYYSSFVTTEDGHKKHTRSNKKPEGHMPKKRKINDSSSMTHRPDQRYKKSPWTINYNQRMSRITKKKTQLRKYLKI
jgi:hypothetical protein